MQTTKPNMSLNCPDANVADVLRCHQRDELFVNEMQSSIQEVMKLFLGSSPSARKYHHRFHRLGPNLTNAWYYFMTTLGNLQTLGEEYTGTVRANDRNQIPSKMVELLWMSFYIGGDPLAERLLTVLKNNINSWESVTEEAKTLFVKVVNFLQQHRLSLSRIHNSLFYINGKYYNFSNRFMGIKYLLIRDWLQDNTFTQSFRILGYLSLWVNLYNLVQQIWSYSKSSGGGSGSLYNDSLTNISQGSLTSKGCVLCGDLLKNATATPCGHVYCWDCICDSLNYQKICPICRQEVLPSRVIFLQNYS